jgi:hypothetical protein
VQTGRSLAAETIIASMASATSLGMLRCPFSQRLALTGETPAQWASVPVLQERMSQH